LVDPGVAETRGILAGAATGTGRGLATLAGPSAGLGRTALFV